MDVLARCEVCEKRIEGKPITDPDEGTDFCVWCAAALLAAQRNELANQLAGAVSALTELVDAAEPFIHDGIATREYTRFLAAMNDARPHTTRGQYEAE